jgi:hypothetical protein
LYAETDHHDAVIESVDGLNRQFPLPRRSNSAQVIGLDMILSVPKGSIGLALLGDARYDVVSLSLQGSIRRRGTGGRISWIALILSRQSRR